MNRKLTAAILAGFFILSLAALTYWGLSRFGGGDTPGAGDDIAAVGTLIEAGEAILYFPGRGGRLYAERRSLSAALAGEERLQLIVEELLLGPSAENLFPTLPSHVELGGLTIDTDGTLFLDLNSKEGALRGLGSTSELLAVYSLVDTVLANEPQARSVVLLWNGRQQPSLAGHIDTARPLVANRTLISESS